MTKFPLISIGITCYNAEKTINRAIGGAIHQTWPNTEILIVDDNSSDMSLSILNKIQTQHPAIRIFFNSANKGVAFNRQALIDEARGEFIAFMDDDDFSFPYRLQEQFSRIKTYSILHNTEKILCFGDRVVFKEGQQGRDVYGIGRKDPAPSGLMVTNALLLGKKDKLYHWGGMGAGTMMCSLAQLRALGFDSSFRRGAEFDLSIRAGMQGFHFISVNLPVIEQYVGTSPDKHPVKRCWHRFILLYKFRSYLVANKVLLRALYRYSRYVRQTLGGTMKHPFEANADLKK